MMNKTWNTPEIELLNVKETASGWDALKIDWSFDGLPLIGNTNENNPS